MQFIEWAKLRPKDAKVDLPALMMVSFVHKRATYFSKCT